MISKKLPSYVFINWKMGAVKDLSIFAKEKTLSNVREGEGVGVGGGTRKKSLLLVYTIITD